MATEEQLRAKNSKSVVVQDYDALVLKIQELTTRTGVLKNILKVNADRLGNFPK